MPSQDLTVLVAVIEGLTKTCAELVVEVRALREALGTGIIPALPAIPAREVDVAVDEPRPQAADEPVAGRRRQRAAAAAPRAKTKPPDSPAVAWLEARGLRVIRFAPGNGDEKALLPLAVEMGDHLSDLRPLHDAIRDAQADGREFNISLRDRTGQAVSRCIQWATKLQERGLLQDVNYSRGNRTLSARTQAGGVAQAFFSGRWFELYLKAKIERILTARKLKFDTLMNACVRLPNGRSRELDLFFLVEQEPIWIECKTGAYRDQRDRLRKLRTQMQVPPERSILAVLDVSPASAADRSRRWGLAVTGTDGVEQTILRALGLTQDGDASQEAGATPAKPATIASAAGQASAAPTAEKPTSSTLAPAIASGELEKFLIRKLLRPQPEQRRAVLAALVPVLAEADGPATGEDLIARLEPRFPDLTKANLTGIVRAALQGGGLLDKNGQPAKSLKTPIRKILPNVAELDARCRRAYAGAIIQADREWFKDARNQAEFRTTVGGPAPSRGQLAQLRKQAADEMARVESKQAAKSEEGQVARGETAPPTPPRPQQPAAAKATRPPRPQPDHPTTSQPVLQAETALTPTASAESAQAAEPVTPPAPEPEAKKAAKSGSRRGPRPDRRQASEAQPATVPAPAPVPAAEAQPAPVPEPELLPLPEPQQAPGAEPEATHSAEPPAATVADAEPKKPRKPGSRRRPKPRANPAAAPLAAFDEDPLAHLDADPFAEPVQAASEAAPFAEFDEDPFAHLDADRFGDPDWDPLAEPVQVAEDRPKKAARPGPRKRAESKPKETAASSPAPIAEPEPVQVAEPEPVQVAEDRPKKAAPSRPSKRAKSKPKATAASSPAPVAEAEPEPAAESAPKQATPDKPRQPSKSRSRRAPKTTPKQTPEGDAVQAAEVQPE